MQEEKKEGALPGTEDSCKNRLSIQSEKPELQAARGQAAQENPAYILQHCSRSFSLLARSLAGHDRGKVYMVLQDAPDVYYLVNGTTRPLTKPKCKKKKHVQIIRWLPDELLAQMSRVKEDKDIADILQTYDHKE